MEQRIIVNLGQGSWQQGFPTITVQLWSGGGSVPMQFSGMLPAASGLLLLYERWQAYYRALNGNLGFRKSQSISSIEIEDDDITHVSNADFDALCAKLKKQFNAWLSVSSFVNVERQLRTHLDASNQIHLIIEANDSSVRRFPWHLWDFLEDYRQAEVAIASLERKRHDTTRDKKTAGVRILSILGDTTGIQVSKDRALLENLADVDAVVLDEPSRAELDNGLWDERGWDVLFFAGHSASLVGDMSGQIKINAADSLSISQLKYGLQTAIKKGLRLAIFNSCDGMGLARELADLHIPYLIVMREPIPDPVAQAFLMNFFRAFAAGIPFHLAVREARERLQGMEGQFPCASWLPVLCQNPGLGSLTWHELRDPASQEKISLRQHFLEALMAGAIASLLALAASAIGILEPYELSAYDQFINWQPHYSSPERILVVEATQADINAYGSPIPNNILAQAVDILESYQPRVIGVDIFRNRLEPNQAKPFAPEENSIYDQFTSRENLIATCSMVTDSSPGVPPPPALPAMQVGFSNVLKDYFYDNAVRRQLVFATPDPNDLCSTEFSLSSMVALHYLDKDGIQPETVGEQMHLGQAVFSPMSANSGGYRKLDDRGFQVMLGYTDSEQFAQSVSLSDVLAGELPVDDLSDYGVLIGVSDPFSNDLLTTPESVRSRQKQPMPGVIVQAHMLNYLLDTALGDRPVINVLPSWMATVWIVSFSILGAGLGAVAGRASFWSLTLGVATLGLFGLCFGLFILGWWVPWVPAAMSLILGSSGLWAYKSLGRPAPSPLRF